MEVNSTTEKTIQSDLNAELVHEIGHPIHAILSLCKLLEDTNLDITQRSYLNHIYQSAEFLHRLVMSNGQTEGLEATHFQLKGLVDHIYHMVFSKAEEKKITFTCNIEPATTSEWTGHANSVRQILLNLLDNAIKYTEQGFVKLSVCETKNGDLRFIIEDTGIGIEASDLPEILQPYVKLKKDKEGLGLGLSIVHKKVKQLGGQMEIVSELHYGTKVMVTLPLQKKNTPQYLENTDASTILLVDDHELVRMVTSKILTKEGFHVITAENGKDALDFLQREAIDCVLVDMEMPVMGGLETLQNIRQQGWHQLPVIVMTARAEVENEQRWRTLGFDGFIFKPSAPNELLTIVSKFLFHKKPVK